MTPPLEDIKVDLVAQGDLQHHVYLIHLLNPFKHARHYLGYTADLHERLHQHRIGGHNSSCFMRAVHREGIEWTVTRIWSFETKSEALALERSIKKAAQTARHCPLCRASELMKIRDSMRALRERRRLARAGVSVPCDRSGDPDAPLPSTCPAEPAQAL